MSTNHPRRRASDHALFGLTKDRIEGLIASALVGLCCVLWTSNTKQATAEQQIRAATEFRERQIQARDREIDDLRQRVQTVEGRCR